MYYFVVRAVCSENTWMRTTAIQPIPTLKSIKNIQQTTVILNINDIYFKLISESAAVSAVCYGHEIEYK